MKIPVLLADDESLLRSLVKRLINWDELDLEVVCEAADGKEAIQLIETHNPQIAIIDINMPYINGLELTQLISEKFPNIQVIILTGYPDFSYAQKALRAKAVNYITKPIDASELKEALIQARDSVITKDSFNREYVSLMSEAFRGQAAIKSDYIRRLINGFVKDNEQDILRQLQQWNEHWQPGGFIVMVINVEPEDSYYTDSSDQVLFLNALANIALEIVNRNRACDALTELDLTIAMIVQISQAEYEAGLTPLVNDCQEIIQLSRHHLKINPTIVLGSIQSSATAIAKSYKDANHLLKERFYNRKAIMVFQPETTSTLNKIDHIPAASAINILSDLMLGHFEEAAVAVENIFREAEIYRVPEEYIKSISINILSVFQNYLSHKNLSLPEFSLNGSLDFAISTDSIQELRDNVLYLLKAIIEQAEAAYETIQIHPTVKKALIEIDQRFNDPELSLDQIAKTIFTNPSYLSTLFKKETGKTLTEYLVAYRMKKAFDLLKVDLRSEITDIATNVGYRDVYYFSRCFKRHFGVSPNHIFNS